MGDSNGELWGLSAYSAFFRTPLRIDYVFFDLVTKS